MIVSQKGKFIFVHVQKNAGISVEKVLKDRFSDARHWHGRHGHVINGIEEIGRESWDAYFSFSIVRNPWDRMVSWYSMIQREYKKLPSIKQASNAPFDSPFWNHVVRDSHDFESFLRNCTDVIYENDCHKSFAFNQADYLVDENGNLAIDFVGRFETLAADMSDVFRRLGIKRAKLPKKNTSRHVHYSEYYTPDTRDLVARRFEKDIEMFNYSFD